MWSRLKKIKRFNIFLLSLLALITVILAIEIFGSLINGSDISSEDLGGYVMIWLSFFFGLIFINFVDFIVEGMSGKGPGS